LLYFALVYTIGDCLDWFCVYCMYQQCTTEPGAGKR